MRTNSIRRLFGNRRVALRDQEQPGPFGQLKLALHVVKSLRQRESIVRILIRSALFLLILVQISSAQQTVRVFAQGDSSRLPNFIESCKKEFNDNGMILQLVRPDEGYDYNIV